MFKLRLRILGASELSQAVRRENAVRLTRVQQGVAEAGEWIIGAAREMFKGERTRALYMIRGGRRVPRKPPRPVTSPPDTLGVWEGTYRRAISKEVHRAGTRVRAEVGPVAIPYARRHEYGTKGMPKRPVMNPAVDKSEAKVFALIGAKFRVV